MNGLKKRFIAGDSSKSMLYSIDIYTLIFLAVFPLFVNAFRIQIMAKCLSYIVFAYSIDLIWGYVGLMSMGQAIFFGIGAYILAIGYSMENGVPSYMTSLGKMEAPAVYYFLANKPVAFITALVLCGVIAGILGIFLFSKKVNSVFFSLITFALARVFELFITDQQEYTGGANGITNIPCKLLVDVEIPQEIYYYFLLGIVVIAYLICRFITNSKYGLVLKSVRENEDRLDFFGYNVVKIKVTIFIISAILAGLSGIMFTTSQSFIGPSNVGIEASTAVLVWVALGGRGNITGAAIGTLVVNWAESLFSEQITDYWPILYGIMILLVVFFLPKGIIGTIQDAIYNHQVAKKQNA